MAYKGTNHKGGRPKGSVGETQKIAMELKAQMARKLKERFGPIMDAQLDAAVGIQTEQFNRSTGNLYYKDLGPNTFAFKNILEQVTGRPKESVELSGKDGMPIDIKLANAFRKVYGKVPE